MKKILSLLAVLLCALGQVFAADVLEVKEDTEVLLTKENINAQDYLSVTTDNWQTGKTYGDVTGDFYNMSKTDRKLTLKVKNVSKAEVFVYNSNAGRSYTVAIGDAEAVEVPHGGTGLESKEFDTPKGEFSIVLAGTGSSVYPTKIKLTYAPEEQGGGAGGTVLYKKISSNNELETGEYLIVCEGQNVAFDGSLETLDAVNDIIQVTISDNTIASDEKTDAATFTIDASTGYIKSKSGFYIGSANSATSTSNGLKQNAEAKDFWNNDISFDADGNAIIILNGEMALRFNASESQMRFRYYKNNGGTQQLIQLYKKVTTSEGGSSTEVIERTVMWKATATTGIDPATTLIDSDQLNVKTVYKTTLTEDAQTFAGQDFTHFIQVRNGAYPTADKPEGTDNGGSTSIIFTPKEDVKVTIYMRRQSTAQTDNKGTYVDGDGKDLIFFDQADASKVAGTLTIDSETADGKYGYATKTVDLKAGKVYTLSAKGTTGRVYGIAYTYKEVIDISDGSFSNYTSFDFNSCADGAVSKGGRHGGDITEAKTFTDTEGKNPSNATLVITPNTNIGDYPAEAVNVSRFVLTEAGPQLRLSGGYNGMTLKISKGDVAINEIQFHQTNWSRNTVADKGTFDPQTGTWLSDAGTTEDDVTFTIKADTTEIWADGKLQEIVLHDMGQLWINSIEVNPLHGVDIAPSSGAELSAVIKAELEKVKNPEYIKVTLEAGGQYTVKEKIVFNSSIIINGNGAGIDASELDEPLIALTDNLLTKKNQDKYTDADTKDFNLLDEITIDNVMIKNMKNAIVSTNGQDWAVENLTITNSIIQLDNDSYTFLRFDQTKNNKGAVKNLNIQNNTIYNLKENKTGYFFRLANASNAAKAFGTNNGTSTYNFTISNNTIIRTMTAKDFANNMVNNSKVTMTVQNNIFYDVYRLYQLIQVNQMSTTTDNYIYYDVTAPQNNDQSRTDKQGNPYTTKLESAPFEVPTEALDLSKANGGLNLTPTGDASNVGDPRWLGGSGAGEVTGIETVKNASAEDGAWYTLSGQRVAQPTKGLYIHNGRKVIIK